MIGSFFLNRSQEERWNSIRRNTASFELKGSEISCNEKGYLGFLVLEDRTIEPFSFKQVLSFKKKEE